MTDEEITYDDIKAINDPKCPPEIIIKFAKSDSVVLFAIAFVNNAQSSFNIENIKYSKSITGTGNSFTILSSMNDNTPIISSDGLFSPTSF